MFYFGICIMKNFNGLIAIILVGLVVLLPGFSDSSWQGRACIESSDCSKISEPFCITDSVDNVEKCILPKNTSELSKPKEKNEVKEVISLYCSELLWESKWRIYFSEPNRVGDRDWQKTFDSRQSLFLEALCWSFKDWSWGMPFVNWSILSGVYKWDVAKILNLRQISDRKDLCSLNDDPNLSNCDLSIYATKIFDGIMSDLFKIKFAQVLHLDTTEKFDVKGNIEDFMKWYYNIDDEYKDIKKDYSKTVSILQSDLKYYKDVLDTINLIDNSKLATLAKTTECPEDKYMTWIDFIACALHSSQWKWLAVTPSFLTMIYNELLNYQQFIAYYTDWLRNKISTDNSNVDNNKKLIYNAMLNDFIWYVPIQKDAFQTAQQNLEEFSMTYPLHIRILLYVEKVEKFRSKYSEVITLFYSLSEKLQNVQIQP